MFRSLYIALLALSLLVQQAHAHNYLVPGRQWIDGVIRRPAAGDSHQLTLVMGSEPDCVVVSVASGSLPAATLEGFLGQPVRLEGVLQQGAKGYSVQPIQVTPSAAAEAVLSDELKGMEAAAAEIDRLVNLHLNSLPGTEHTAPFIRVGKMRGRRVGVFVTHQTPSGKMADGQKLEVDLEHETVTTAPEATH